MTKENNKVDINKHEVDISTLKKQNVNDLLSIKELYTKIEELGEKIAQIKYIDSTLIKKIKKEYKSLKKIILDENIQVKLANDIETINTNLTNDIETINLQMDNKAIKSTSYEMINIKEYGAKGDGINDDSAIFNDALAKTNHLYIPKGTYNVKGLRCSHPITIEGEKGTVLHCFNNVADYSGLITFFEVEGDINIKNITTTGLQVRCNTVMKFYHCKSDILLQDVTIKDTFNEGVVLDGYNTLRVDNCLFQNTDVCIMIGKAPTVCKNENIFISNSRFEQSTSECISTNFEGKINGDISISNCRLSASTTGGAMLAIMGGNDVLVTNCIFDGKGRQGSFIGKNGDYTDFTTYRLNNCVIKNILNSNIMLSKSTVYINNSHIYNCHAISTTTSSRLVLTNSEINLNDTFTSRGANSIIDNCIISANTVSVLFEGATIRNSTLSNLMIYNDGSNIVFTNNIVNGVKSYLNKNPFSVIETNLTIEVSDRILKPNMLYKNYTVSSGSEIESIDLQNLGGVYRTQEYNLINTSGHDILVTFEGSKQIALPNNRMLRINWVNFSATLNIV